VPCEEISLIGWSFEVSRVRSWQLAGRGIGTKRLGSISGQNSSSSEWHLSVGFKVAFSFSFSRSGTYPMEMDRGRVPPYCLLVSANPWRC
jgi:hypothetical protein